MRAVSPRYDFTDSGSLSVSLYYAHAIGERPTLSATRTMTLATASTTDDWSRTYIDFKDAPAARFFQLQFTATSRMILYGYSLIVDMPDNKNSQPGD